MNVNVHTTNEIDLQPITFCKYRLKIVDKDILLSFPQLLQLRGRINRLSCHNSLEEIIDTENFVLLFIADRQHLVYLDIPMLIDLREQVDSLFYNVDPVLA
jgi:hypothetical protein